MKDEFVTYEQALALKELGFDEECIGYYYRNVASYFRNIGAIVLITKGFPGADREFICGAPLKSQAFRWFRDKYKLHSYIYADYSYNISGGIWDINGYKDCRYDIDSESYSTYEEAEQACLNKLIEIVKINNKL
jgi:hypothetical protein